MNILYVVLTYNRPSITPLSINTLLNHTSVKPSEVWILDDRSEDNMQKSLLDFSQKIGPSVPINLSLKGKNYGIGYSFEEAYSIIKWKNPDVVAIVESDYIWRKEWLEDCLAVFQASPYTVAIAGTSHPDMYDKNRTTNEFAALYRKIFGKDIDSRKYMYQPFYMSTTNGQVQVQGVSNSCGCMILNWAAINKTIFSLLNGRERYEAFLYDAFREREDRSVASDAIMSGSLCWLWEEWADKFNVDKSKHFAMLDICDYSIANHICGGGKNGMIVPEGQTFVGSPKWPENWRTFSRI